MQRIKRLLCCVYFRRFVQWWLILNETWGHFRAMGKLCALCKGYLNKGLTVFKLNVS